MNPNLAIALAVHEGACRIMAARPVMTPEAAVEHSFEAMRRVIPDLDQISVGLKELLIDSAEIQSFLRWRDLQ
ncbi:MAG TPA: hypothetical protein ENI11_00015 [Actinobacteria bacterium]|nr:hypothetical protein [Actinomycetota bacterium]